MSSFLATAEPTKPQTPGSPANATIVQNDGWFPDIDMDALRASMRLDGTATYERLRDATIDAIASVNAELGAWQTVQAAAGHADLAAVPAPRIGGESVQLARYRRAVFNLTHADLTERYRDFDSTKAGGQKAEDLETTICNARRNVRWALSDMHGLPRSTIELI
jgi:hypothetical protein